VDRIDLLDAGFLHLETREAPMHVAGLNLFEARLGETYRSSTELRKPFAHRVAQGMLGRFGPLYWEEDPDLDLDYHVQHAALPKPGRYRELFALVSRLHSTLLDRSRPLWEAHLIEGLQNRQFAVYSKLHHATIDGVAGVRITEGGCSPDPDAEINVSPLSIEAHERYKAKHGKTRNADLAPSEFELKAMAEFFKAQFDTSAHFLGVIKSYAATWLGLGDGLAVPWRHVPHTIINTQVSSARCDATWTSWTNSPSTHYEHWCPFRSVRKATSTRLLQSAISSPTSVRATQIRPTGSKQSLNRHEPARKCSANLLLGKPAFMQPLCRHRYLLPA
jgi:diacylglycerol O-acyltransferase